LEFLGF